MFNFKKKFIFIRYAVYTRNIVFMAHKLHPHSRCAPAGRVVCLGKMGKDIGGNHPQPAQSLPHVPPSQNPSLCSCHSVICHPRRVHLYTVPSWTSHTGVHLYTVPSWTSHGGNHTACCPWCLASVVCEIHLCFACNSLVAGSIHTKVFTLCFFGGLSYILNWHFLIKWIGVTLVNKIM